MSEPDLLKRAVVLYPLRSYAPAGAVRAARRSWVKAMIYLHTMQKRLDM